MRTHSAGAVHLQRGFSMVEALVTVLIFAIGLLGVISLQSLALSSSNISNLRTVATVLAFDMADRMRANRGAALGTVGTGYDGMVAVNNSCRATYKTSLQAAPATCTSAQMAADDMFDWTDQVQTTLPNGNGWVCIDSTPNDGVAATPACDGLGSAYAIKIWWSQKASKNFAAAVTRFSMVVRP